VNFNNPKTRKMIALIILLVIIAMVATMVLPGKMVPKRLVPLEMTAHRQRVKAMNRRRGR